MEVSVIRVLMGLLQEIQVNVVVTNVVQELNP